MSSATANLMPTGLLTLVAPLMGGFRRRLRREVARFRRGTTPLPFEAATFDALLYPQLANQMFTLVSKTAVLELHVARLRGDLVGQSSYERFDEFSARLAMPEVADEIFREYPVLQQQATLCAQQWLLSSLELARRLAADWTQMCEAFFGGADPGPLVAVEGGVGDRHCGGRSVQILHFASGRRLVYKPKSLAVEARFGDLLRWLNARGGAPQLRPLAVVEKSNYGWLEFVPRAACQSPLEVERFYERQGAYLALLHLLAATDFHFENIVAAGEHPVLIDLEALFHQRLPGSSNEEQREELIDSVMAVRLLPQVSYVDGCVDPIDFSGLGATPGRATPFRMADFAGDGTDEMRLTYATYHLREGHHRPTLRGAAMPLCDYELAVAAGFTKMYQLLLAHRAGLLVSNGPLAAFSDAEVRFIARPTQVYAILLEQSTHPDQLRSQAARTELFDRLNVRAEALPCLHRLLAAELADMDEHNIPIFTTRPNSRDLWSSRGRRIAKYFNCSGLDLVRNRLRGFGESDFSRQTAFIRRSFASLV